MPGLLVRGQERKTASCLGSWGCDASFATRFFGTNFGAGMQMQQRLPCMGLYIWSGIELPCPSARELSIGLPRCKARLLTKAQGPWAKVRFEMQMQGMV